MRVFALDTGRLPDETYLTAERVRMKYGIDDRLVLPAARRGRERCIRLKGLYSFRDSLDNRHECCGIRKVEPLGRALAGVEAWMTGLRNEQSVTRTDTPEIEIDAAHGGIAKLNPLVRWTDGEVRGLREGAPGPRAPHARPRLPVDRLRPLHPRHQARRAPALGPLVVGGSREQGVRDPLARAGDALAKRS